MLNLNFRKFWIKSPTFNKTNGEKREWKIIRKNKLLQDLLVLL